MRSSMAHWVSRHDEEQALARWLDAHDFDLITSPADRERLLAAGRREVAVRSPAAADS